MLLIGLGRKEKREALRLTEICCAMFPTTLHVVPVKIQTIKRFYLCRFAISATGHVQTSNDARRPSHVKRHIHTSLFRMYRTDTASDVLSQQIGNN